MTHQAAVALGQTLRVLSGTSDEPAAQVSPDVVLGSHTDLDALRRAAVGSNALTFDHEHVPTEHLEVLVAEGVNVQPPPQALIFAQDKLLMRRKLAELGAPVPAYAEVTWAEDVVRFGAQHGWPLVIKATRGGYDGRGVWITDDQDEAEAIVTEQLDKGVPLIVEEMVSMRRELSAMVARVAVRPGRYVAGRRDGSAQRPVRRRDRTCSRPFECRCRGSRTIGVAHRVRARCCRLDGRRTLRDD